MRLQNPSRSASVVIIVFTLLISLSHKQDPFISHKQDLFSSHKQDPCFASGVRSLVRIYLYILRSILGHKGYDLLWPLAPDTELSRFNPSLKVQGIWVDFTSHVGLLSIIKSPHCSPNSKLSIFPPPSQLAWVSQRKNNAKWLRFTSVVLNRRLKNSYTQTRSLAV